jgi:hypothetical protein
MNRSKDLLPPPSFGQNVRRVGDIPRDYNDLVAPGAERVRDALVNLLGGHPVEAPASARRVLGEMAGSDEMLALLKALPAAAAVGGVGSAIGSTGDLVTGEEAPNRAMDLLGMGAGALRHASWQSWRYNPSWTCSKHYGWYGTW